MLNGVREYLRDDKYLFCPKLITFLGSIASASFGSMNVYLTEQLGINQSDLGNMSATITLLGMFAPILWTRVVDRVRRYKQFVVMAHTLNAVFITIISLLDAETPGLIFLVAGCQLASKVVMGGVHSMQMKIILDLLRNYFNDDNEQALLYLGRQHIFSYFGQIISSNVSAALYQRNPTYCFIYMNITTAISMLAIIFLLPADKPLPFLSKNRKKALEEELVGKYGGGSEKVVMKEKEKWTKDETPPVAKSKVGAYRRLLKIKTFVFFLVVVAFCGGFAMGTVGTFLSVFIKENVIYDMQLVQLSHTLGTIAEILVTLFMKELVSSCGIYWLLILSQFTKSYALVFYGFFQLDDPCMTLPIMVIEVMKGLGIGFISIAGMGLVAEMIPRGYEATAMGMQEAIMGGIAPAIGGYLGGYLSQFDTQLIFQVAAYVTTFALVATFVYFRFVYRKLEF